MKKKLFFTFCVLLLSIQSCTKGVVVDESTVDVKLNKGQIQMSFKALAPGNVESSESGTNAFNFLSHDSIGLFLLKSPSTLTDSRYCDNELFLCGEEGTITTEPALYYPTTGDICSILAYYPYQEEMLSDETVKHHFKLPTDQSNINLHDIDFMVCRKEGVIPSDEPVSLTFQHQLARVSIVLQPSDHYNATQLMEYNPQISFHNIFSEADYDFKFEHFSNQIQAGTIIPNGQWEIDEQGNLVGKTCLLLPESFIPDQSYFELLFNGNKYRMTVSGDDLSSLPDAQLTSGANIKCIFSTKSSDLVGSVLEATFKVDVADWPIPTEKQYQLEDASAEYYYINIADIDFSKTQIYHICNKEKDLYEISRQVVIADGKPQVDIVLIPLDDTGDVVYEKRVNLWAGNNHKTEYLFFDHSGNYNFVETSNCSKVGLKKVDFFDVRMGNTIPLVRIADKVWFGDDYKVDYLVNSVPLKLTNDFSKCQTVPAYHKVNTGDEVHYVYNKIAITNPYFIPQGYHIPTVAECNSLYSIYRDNLSTLVSPVGWQPGTDVADSSILLLQPNTSYASGRNVNSSFIASFWSLNLNEVSYCTFDYYVDNKWAVRDYKEGDKNKKDNFLIADTGFAVRLVKN